MSNKKVVHLYRSLCREIKRTFHPRVNLRSTWISLIRKEFRQPITSPSTFETNFTRGEEYLHLLQSKNKQKELFEKYAVGGTIAERDYLRRISQRVGLTIPDFPDEKEKRIRKELQQPNNN